MENNKLSYHGKGAELFGIIIVNFFLTLLTLGFYYPWAKVKKLKYIYNSTEFSGNRFEFHGTGQEMFVGMIKAIAIFIVLFMLLLLANVFYKALAPLWNLIYVLVLNIIIPIALHGALKYRLSRTSWRGIHFGYRGILSELFKKYFMGVFLSIITIGIYASWFQVDLRKYIFKYIRFGNVRFSFNGEGRKLFIINLKGILLSIITLGIYLFWFIKERFNFMIENTTIESNGQSYQIKANATGLEILKLELVNVLLLLITLGIAYPWVLTRELRYFVSKIEVPAEFDCDSINQTEEGFGDASGSSILDLLDLGLVF
jgi:uncharacterized membrane protein YjgN (DUF898 family)